MQSFQIYLYLFFFGRTLLPLGFFFFFNNFIYLYVAVLDLGCCPGFALLAVSGVYCLVAALGLHISVASLVAEYGL